ncbi:MAG: mycoredoxin [Geodermatophilaceae bacterium]|nr:mycoredoxin [Geodermatophilaceae bacterium]MDQ3454742.1 mycoredoxin [Actinomycetota bacterium]
MPAPSVTMYTTSWCGYCVRLKRLLDRADIDFAEVNIEYDEAAVELVMRVNGGNQTVPTLVFRDGSALTNPTIDQVKDKLAA